VAAKKAWRLLNLTVMMTRHAGGHVTQGGIARVVRGAISGTVRNEKIKLRNLIWTIPDTGLSVRFNCEPNERIMT
jgi:hypothetical protein